MDSSSASHAAIIGDYHFNGLDGDMVVINALDLGGLFEDAFRASSYSLDPARGLIRNDSSQDVDLVLGEETIAHIANVDDEGGAADAPIAFAVWGGVVMGVASIEDGATVQSLYPTADDCDCLQPVEILLGGAGSQILKAGATWISLLGGGSGNDELIGATGANFYLGGQGDDKIMLKGTIPDSDDDLISLPDTVVFGKTAAHNGFDEIFNFVAGDGGDVLDFSAFTAGEDFELPLFGLEDAFVPSYGRDATDIDEYAAPAESISGHLRIRIVTYEDDLFDTMDVDTASEGRYVVLDQRAERTVYDVYFVEEAVSTQVATIELAEEVAFTEWNFTPWLSATAA